MSASPTGPDNEFLSKQSESPSLWRRSETVIPGGVNSGQRRIAGLEGLIVAATDGSRIIDTAGRSYVDFHAAFGTAILGYNDASVDSAVATTSRELGLCGVGVTPVEIDLAERLVDLVPSYERVLLTGTGSEATYHAIRLARAATGRRLIVKFQGCYHGWHDAVAMNVISRPEAIGSLDPLSAGSMKETVEATIVLAFNDLPAVQRAFIEFGSEIAALIVEPIPHNVGALLPAPGFLAGLHQLCHAHGAILIFDEVITGFRHALGGYQQICGVVPDLTTIGKAMANGYPIGALGGRGDLMEMFSTTPGKPVFFAGTYNGHPAMAAAALATIDKLQREPVHDHIFSLGERAREGLSKLFDELGITGVVAGFGSVWVTYFLDPPVSSYNDLVRNDVDLFVGYRKALMKHGFFELPLNLKRSHVSYAHTAEQIDGFVHAAGIAIEEATASKASEFSTQTRNPAKA